VPGPAYLHFPRDPAFDDEYFAQLAAEKLVTKIKGTRPFQEWVQTRPRNEALDCLLYALAALRLSGKTPAAPVASPAADPAAAPHQPGAPRRPMLPRGINHTPAADAHPARSHGHRLPPRGVARAVLRRAVRPRPVKVSWVHRVTKK
jgi:phage terminase large subunit GpA-like protein